MSLTSTAHAMRYSLSSRDKILADASDTDRKFKKVRKLSKSHSHLYNMTNTASEVFDDNDRRIFFFDEEESLLCSSRKSLIREAEAELNSIAQKLHIPGLSQVEYETTVYDVLPYVLNSDVSHIALRHLAHALSSDQGHIFAFTFYSPVFTEHLVHFFVNAAEFLDWASLDDILSPVFAEDRWGFSDFTRPDAMDRIWSKALEQALRFCDKLPNMFQHLKQRIDVNRNIRAGTLRSLATFPTLLLRSAYSKHGGRFDALEHIGRPPRALNAPCLSGLRKYLLSGPDAILSSILRARETTSTSDGYHFVDKAANSHELRLLCQALVSLLMGDDDRVRSRAEFHIAFVASLDRYCLNAMRSAVKAISKGMPTARTDTVQDALQEVMLGRRRKNAEADSGSAWVYRHRSLDHGRTHIRHGLAFSRRHPCETCVALGIWEDWVNSPDASCEALVADDDQLLWLYQEPGQSFSAEGHIPIYCGINELGESEYVGGAGVMHQGYFVPAFSRTASCTVTKGSRGVQYEDDGAIIFTPHYRVLVLRYDHFDDPESGPGSSLFGLDPTGPTFWREAWVDDEDDESESMSDRDEYDSDIPFSSAQ